MICFLYRSYDAFVATNKRTPIEIQTYAFLKEQYILLYTIYIPQLPGEGC